LVKDQKQEEDWDDAIRKTRARILPKLMKWALEEATGFAVVQEQDAEMVREDYREEDPDADPDVEMVRAEAVTGAPAGDREEDREEAGEKDRNNFLLQTLQTIRQQQLISTV
jgi:hypothetical protein